MRSEMGAPWNAGAGLVPIQLSRRGMPPLELGSPEFRGPWIEVARNPTQASRYSDNPPKPPGNCKGLDNLRLERITEYIRVHLSNQLSLEELASVACLSHFHLCRMFKISTGQTLHQYVTRLRIERSQRLLLQNKLSVAEIAVAVGFGDQSRFTCAFRRVTGLPPAEWRRMIMS